MSSFNKKPQFGIRDNVGWVTEDETIDPNPRNAMGFDSFEEARQWTIKNVEYNQFFCVVQIPQEEKRVERKFTPNTKVAS